MSLASRLRQARQEADLTQQRAADLAEVEPNTVWRYEAGQREPSALTLRSLARVYNKPVDWFWEDEPELPPLTPDDIEADRELIMNEASLALRTTSKDLSDEAIKSIADFIRFVHAREERERRERQTGG